MSYVQPEIFSEKVETRERAFVVDVSGKKGGKFVYLAAIGGTCERQLATCPVSCTKWTHGAPILARIATHSSYFLCVCVSVLLLLCC